MAEISKIQPFGLSTQYDIHALRADYIEGTNDAANPGGALLRSGAGRADASPGGDTWIYWDTLGGTSSYWGIRHNQAANTIGFCGSGSERVTIHMGESKVTATTFAGNATSATKLSNTPNNTSTFLRGDNTWSNTLISTTGTTSNAALNLYDNTEIGNGQWAQGLWFLAPNGASGANMSICLGEKTGTKNAGNIAFHYAGEGSNSNYVGIGLTTVDYLVRAYGSGNVSIGEDNNNYKLNVNGTSNFKSTLSIISSNNGSYNEGIRIHSASNSWGTITLCGPDNIGDSGTSAKTWLIGNYNGNFYISKNGSNSASTLLKNVDNVWSWTGTASGSISGNAETASRLNITSTDNAIARFDGTNGTIQNSGVTIDDNNNISSSGYLWIKGTGTANRMSISGGHPWVGLYTSGYNGTRIYANGIGFSDVYLGQEYPGNASKISNDSGWLRFTEETANSGSFEIAVGDDGTEPIYVRQYNTSSAVAAEITLLNGSHNSEMRTIVPKTNNTYTLGTNTNYWNEISTQNFRVNLLRNINGGAKVRFCNDSLVTTSTQKVGTETNLTTSDNDTEWLQALLKAICATYPNEGALFRGIISPNSILYYEIYIYNTSDVNENGIPRYSFGTYSHWSTGHGQFGTSDYSFWRYDIVRNTGTWGISITGNAAIATKATQDSDGNQINTTYLKLSGGTMTGASGIQFPTTNDTARTGHWISAGGGYGTGSGKNGLKILVCDSGNNNSSGFGQDLSGQANELSIVAAQATNDNSHITFVGHKGATPTTYTKFADINNLGCLSIYSSGTSYNQGIRAHAADDGWSLVTLCGLDNTGDTGTSANSWLIGNQNGNLYITRNGATSSSSAILKCVDNIWSWNGTASGNAATATKLLTNGTIGQFWRGDNTWSNTLGNFIFNSEDMSETAANLSGTTSAHNMTFYRNGISIPYQMDNSNDGGILRVRGTSESNTIFEMATWDDSGNGETIQFNYYPTTSRATPTYSVSVPKATGTICLTNGTGASGTWGISISGNAATATKLGTSTIGSSENIGIYLNNGVPTPVNTGVAHYTKTFTVTGDKDTYYPVVFSATSDKTKPHIISIWKNLGSTTAVYPGNHSNGTSSMWLMYEYRTTVWDGNGGYCKTLYYHMGYATLVAKSQLLGNGVGCICVWLRGGTTEYKVSSDYNITATPYYEETNVGNSTYPVNIAPVTEVISGGWKISSTVLGYGNIDGNATTATKLSTTGTTGQFWRGDNTWSNTITGGLTVSANTYPSLTLTRSDSAETSMYFKNATAGWAIGIHPWSVGAGVFAIGQYFGTGSSTWRFKIDNNGYCHTSSYLNLGGGNENNASSPPRVWGTNGSDNYLRTYQTSSLNVNSATKLTTARNINGTSFDGSANITTVNWGTARNIYIADSDGTNTGAAVSVNGSAAVTLKLPATIKASITGNCSGSSGSCTGNAATATNATNATNIYSSASTSKAYVLGTLTASSANHGTVYNASVYTQGTVLYGAAWNDYAEYREVPEDDIEAGRCVREVGDDTLVRSTERLQKGCEIVSDTYGFAIGQTEKANTPIAVTGRVLAYVYEGREVAREHIGDCVCSGPDGTVSIMTEEEERMYPGRIIGTISAVPDYEIWNETVKVNGRVWIRI